VFGRFATGAAERFVGVNPALRLARTHLAAALLRRLEHREYVCQMPRAQLSLIEFPADDPERAQRFWEGLLEEPLDDRDEREGTGRQTRSAVPAVGVHARGRGPGDTASLPYFAVGDMAAALQRVRGLGGSVVHPGGTWSVCRDSEGTPFGLAASPPRG
jgi:predicted enzyme related to lactoylglutathione lyase